MSGVGTQLLKIRVKILFFLLRDFSTGYESRSFKFQVETYGD